MKSLNTQGGLKIGGLSEPVRIGLTPEGQPPQNGVAPQMLEMYANQFAIQRPQQLAQIRAAILEAMQAGELTPQELNTITQLATIVARNPELYPYVRRFAIQQGIATEQDIPQQYDPGLVFVFLLAARAVQTDIGGQNILQGGSPADIRNEYAVYRNANPGTGS